MTNDPGMRLVSHEDVERLDMPPDAHKWVAVVIQFSARLDEIKTAANAVTKYLKFRPDFKNFILSVDGFDSDPRELDEIPQAQLALRAFGALIGWNGICAFDEESAALIAVCMGYGSRKGMTLYVHPPMHMLKDRKLAYQPTGSIHGTLRAIAKWTAKNDQPR